jgi:AcrR family transcriptional regulator
VVVFVTGNDADIVDPSAAASSERRIRSDAQRNLDTLVQAAKDVFASSGVDAPVREITEKAGVGVATLYRHFPLRSDLVTAVFRREIDACADAAQELAGRLPPGEALQQWLYRFADFVQTKRGLSAALHSGDPVFAALPAYFDARLRPAVGHLVETAVAAGEIRPGVDLEELLFAVVGLCHAERSDRPGSSRRMLGLLFDGLRFRS